MKERKKNKEMNSQLLIGTFRHNVSFQVEQILYLETNSKIFKENSKESEVFKTNREIKN